MSQPLILLMRSISDDYLASLKGIAANYRIITVEEATSVNLDDVEIIVSWRDDLGNKILDSPTSRLKWLQVYSAGVDDLPLAKLKEKNILLSNASGVHSIPISETVIGMLLSHYRGLRSAINNQAQQRWNNRITTTELNGQSMLIVGTGAIGRQLGKVATILGVKVYGINRSGYPLNDFDATYPQSEINHVLPEMDIVVNILPLTPDTYHFYDANRFKHMKDGAVFINVGRGPSVDTEALINACHSGTIGFAGIDVFEDEPLAEDHPLWQMENVLITPHISGKTTEYNRRFFAILSDNLQEYLKTGRLLRNQVKFDQGY
ncbi:phosphoglycerate dehydrogenase [Vagococcus sp. BWB3-3]|uniref:Phosphoglycerate dehydrogenase n=1 Tax=Vagococcus allomyrinae TaxID=2794353 RepID=A0A940SUJ8_9ENTE|nr:phosphoglycerate dehydrogenase [Vagococcus allomyrinae]MBP1041385.1 phosphoglycerate dehydrogenase [Vagococcus allomyrinae]